MACFFQPLYSGRSQYSGSTSSELLQGCILGWSCPEGRLTALLPGFNIPFTSQHAFCSSVFCFSTRIAAPYHILFPFQPQPSGVPQHSLLVSPPLAPAQWYLFSAIWLLRKQETRKTVRKMNPVSQTCLSCLRNTLFSSHWACWTQQSSCSLALFSFTQPQVSPL